MGRFFRWALLACLVAVLLPVAVYAAYTAVTSNPNNKLTAATLVPPTSLSATQPYTTGAYSNTVQLTWPEIPLGSRLTGFRVERSTTYTDTTPSPYNAYTATVAISERAPITPTVTFTDSSAAYNTTYYYRVRTIYQPNWSSSPTGVATVSSLAPNYGYDTTANGSNLLYTLSSTDLQALAKQDGVRYTTRQHWTVGTPTMKSYLIFKVNPPTTGLTTLHSVRVTQVYRMDVTDPAAIIQLLVSTDGGFTWKSPITLPTPATANVDTSVSTDLTASGLVTTTAQLQNMVILFHAGSGTGPSFSTAHDLFHVDVN